MSPYCVDHLHVLELGTKEGGAQTGVCEAHCPATFQINSKLISLLERDVLLSGIKRDSFKKIKEAWDVLIHHKPCTLRSLQELLLNVQKM